MPRRSGTTSLQSAPSSAPAASDVVDVLAPPPPPSPPLAPFQAAPSRVPSSAAFQSGVSQRSPQTVSSSVRKAGKKLASSEVSSVPKARINLNLNLAKEEDLDIAELERSIQMSYGGNARVQIDEVADEALALSAPSAVSSAAPQRRNQKVKARVMFDSAEEARGWEMKSMQSRVVQSGLASAMALDNGAVEFDGGVQMDAVDAVTLKLDSDSAHILCGACLLYDAQNECKKVVCHNDRYFGDGCVKHSGDTQVDGKSVHTIGVVMSKIPDDVTQLFFTICSCGPDDLSGFKNPSIMLYENVQPDANLLEYSIDQAAKSVSSVMARMLRRPVWTAVDRVLIERGLRRLRMPLLCIDLCMAMAAETSWDIQALGTEEWNTPAKICANYGPGKELIQENLRKNTAVTTSRVSVQRGRSSTANAADAAAGGSGASAGVAAA